MVETQRIAVSNAHYRCRPFSLFVENQKKPGYSTVDIRGGAPHFYPDDTTAAGFWEAKGLPEEAGLTAGDYYADPMAYDRRNTANLKQYLYET